MNLKKLCFVLLLLLVSACDVDLQENQPEELISEATEPRPDLPSIQESAQIIQILSQGSTWQVSSRKVNGEVVPLGCHLDDQLIFLESKITFDVGDIRCALPKDSERQIEGNTVGRWQLTDRRSLLIISLGEAPYEAKILAMDEAHLTLEIQQDTYTLVEETYFLVTEQPPAVDGDSGGFGAAPIILD